LGSVCALIQMCAPDSGAGSIASMDTEAAGGQNIVTLLAQRGRRRLLERLISLDGRPAASGLDPADVRGAGLYADAATADRLAHASSHRAHATVRRRDATAAPAGAGNVRVVPDRIIIVRARRRMRARP
jgi:hypothetical protein